MAVVKKSSSGKAIQFILGEDATAGTVFQLSASLFGKIMSEQIQGDFVVLSRMPIPVPGNKFPASKTWGDSSVQSAYDKTGDNAFSKEFLLERKEQAVVKKSKDFKVSW